MQKDLEDFKAQISAFKVRGADDNSTVYANLRSQFKLFRDKYNRDDEKLEALRNKVLTDTNLEKPLSNLENISLKDFNEINKYVKENQDKLSKVKPLGEYGEITLNEAINKGVQVLGPVVNHIKENSEIINYGSIAGSLFLIYKSVVRLYTKVAYSEQPSLPTPHQVAYYKINRAKEIKAFMILGAPFIYCWKYKGDD